MQHSHLFLVTIKLCGGKKQSVEMLVFAGLICLRATFEILGISCKRSALHSLIIPSVSLHFHCKDTIPKEEGKKKQIMEKENDLRKFLFSQPDSPSSSVTSRLPILLFRDKKILSKKKERKMFVFIRPERC